MPKFRKKPVEIEARQLTPKSMEDILAWVPGSTMWVADGTTVCGLMIPTLESPHEASFGDWIIMGIAGEFYPCKPDIFRDSYEVVE